MFYDTEQDPLCYPGTTVLINKPGLENQQDLDDFEFSMFLTRAEEPLPDGNLDYAHYCAIHRHLFQDVYAWAGEPRTIRIGKGGNWFCFPEHLDRYMRSVFDWLAEEEFLQGLDDPTFAQRAAHLLAEMNAGHPFREGNGRTQMAFLKVIVLNSGRSFSDDAIEAQTALDAMITSFSGNLGPLIGLIAAIIA